MTEISEHTKLKLRGLTVELSAPVLVKRSRWFCWFPSLIRQNDHTLWALMTAYADVHVSDMFCYLSRSTDGGRSWDEPRVIGDGGLNHLLLGDGSALVLPCYLRPRSGGAIGAPCNIISPQGQISVRPSGVNVRGWPRNVGRAPDFGTASFVFNGQVIRGQGGEYLTTLYGTFEGDSRYSLVMAESADGFDWHIRSVIAVSDCPLEGQEGPCESALCRLADGRILSIFRLASFVRFGRAFSDDDGRSWSAPANIAPGSVEPSLATLQGDIVALSGGRPGVYVWFNTDGRGEEWQGADIVAHHNAYPNVDPIRNPGMPWLDREEMLAKGLSGFSSCYTELIRLDDWHLLLIYDRLGLGWHQIPDESGEVNSVWVVRIAVSRS